MRHINVALFVPDEGCPHRCSFCNQKTISGSVKRLEVSDVDSSVHTALSSKTDVSGGEIAFFGGSFTAIEKTYMESLLSAAYKYIKDGLFHGIRISTRPDCIDPVTLEILKRYGVTSIEIGCQSMSDRVLLLNERGHTADDIVKASELIKAYGFELGVQMMTGLYGDDDETAIETAEKLIALSPDTARIYPTVVLRKTKLEQLYLSGEYKPQTLDEAVNLCSKLLYLFYKADIPVIRLGLHSGGNVEDGYVAGAYHPAFRELCESKIYLSLLLKELEKQNITGGEITVTVAEKNLSQFLGQKKSNISHLSSLGFVAAVKTSNELSKYQIQVQGKMK